MEVITIESKAWKELTAKIDKIADYLLKIEASQNEGDGAVWLHGKEVMNLLGISTKTLQRLRTEKLISYSILRGRCIYQLSEVTRMLTDRIVKADPAAIEAYRKNYHLNGKK